MSTTHTHYLVVDLEATCADDGAVPRGEMEIIEIGAVLVVQRGAQLETVDEFATFVRPIRHPQLTAFCMKLTTITQSDVDAAPLFPKAVDRLKLWLYAEPREFVFCSWGDYDDRQLRQDCAFHGIPFPIAGQHLNVKKAFASAQGLAKRPGLGQAVEMAGLTFEGTAHRAIADARNIVRLLPLIFGDGRLSKSPKRG